MFISRAIPEGSRSPVMSWRMYSSPLKCRRSSALPSRLSSSAVRVIDSPLSLIPQRLPRRKHVRDALLRLRLGAERDESLAFEVEEVLLIHPLRRRDAPPAQDPCDLP